MSAPLSLDVHDLALERGGRWLVRGVRFRLPPGQGLLVQGPNGCGKSTLLRTLCGLRRPAQGVVRWLDHPLPASLPQLRAELAFLGHDDAARTDLSPAENLRATMALAGEPCDDAAIDAALHAVGLDAQGATRGRALSQGLRRRAALARFWATRRRLWIVDEPLAGLDAEAARAVVERVRTHLHDGGLAVISCHTELWTRTDLPLQRLHWG